MTARRKRSNAAGDTLESVFRGRNLRKEIYGEAVKRVLAWQLAEAMREAGVSKSTVAAKMPTSRTQLDRILDPKNVAVSLETLDRAARVLGKRLKVELVDA